MQRSTHKFSVVLFFFCFFALMLAGCGGGSISSNLGGGGSGSGTALPAPDHVIVVVLENHSFSQVIGSPSMPYLNSLATAHSLATNFFGNVHPSIGNYLMLTTGNIETIDDNSTQTFSDDNIERALLGAGKTWKAYMESIPAAGYLGPNTGFYLRHHNPFAYFSDNQDAQGRPTAQAANMVPFTQLQADMAAGTVPSFAFIAPNSVDDAHDCPGGASTCADTDKLAAADTWLKTNIDPLINNSAFANSVFIITWDEGDLTDLNHIGGQVATVLVGTHVKAGFKSTTFYQHQNTLRLVLDLLKVGDRPGLSAAAGSMNEFFQ